MASMSRFTFMALHLKTVLKFMLVAWHCSLRLWTREAVAAGNLDAKFCRCFKLTFLIWDMGL